MSTSTISYVQYRYRAARHDTDINDTWSEWFELATDGSSELEGVDVQFRLKPLKPQRTPEEIVARAKQWLDDGESSIEDDTADIDLRRILDGDF